MSKRLRTPVVDCFPSRLPAGAGVYSIWRDGTPVYVGKAKSLAARLGRAHRGRGLSMGNSALRRNVAEHLGFGSADVIKKGDRRLSPGEVAQVNEYLDACEAAWIVTTDEAAALRLETEFKEEFTPLLTKR